jgi:hypothetical protein
MWARPSVWLRSAGRTGCSRSLTRAARSSPHSAAFMPAGIIVDDRDDNRIRLLTGTGLQAA